uniref:Reverse transcriptase domain-containing protein n=1 Tax=Tanacetum cinerariifolium TaxID=118510 RepID=A0A699H1K7_TANCI|nr:hypothetical protein [Tanacetum cinerariifolium]
MDELEQVKKEKEGLDSKLTGFNYASKDLDTLLGSQRTDKNKEGLPEFANDYSRPTPSIESNSSDLQNSTSLVSEHEESSSSIMAKPMIKFVKAADSPKVIKTNKVKTARKSFVKYTEMYRNTSKSPKVRVGSTLTGSGNSLEHFIALTVGKCTSRGITITSSGNVLEHFIPNGFLTPLPNGTRRHRFMLVTPSLLSVNTIL